MSLYMTRDFNQKSFNSNILWNQQNTDLASSWLAEVPHMGSSSCTMKQPAMGDQLDPELKSAQKKQIILLLWNTHCNFSSTSNYRYIRRNWLGHSMFTIVARMQSLLWELRSHIKPPHAIAKIKIKINHEREAYRQLGRWRRGEKFQMAQ